MLGRVSRIPRETGPTFKIAVFHVFSCPEPQAYLWDFSLSYFHDIDMLFNRDMSISIRKKRINILRTEQSTAQHSSALLLDSQKI